MDITKIIDQMRDAAKYFNEHNSDSQGIITCNVCSGKLHIAKASYNGHLRAKCETDDCAQWMQ